MQKLTIKVSQNVLVALCWLFIYGEMYKTIHKQGNKKMLKKIGKENSIRYL